jgi:hypothetical protein
MVKRVHEAKRLRTTVLKDETKKVRKGEHEEELKKGQKDIQKLKNMVVWVVTPCISERVRRFRGTYRLHL